MGEKNLVEVISDTAYSELNQLMSIYKRTDELENCLHLMQPNNFVNIVKNASDNLSELGIEVMNRIYEFYYDELDYKQKMELQPSLKMQKAFHSYLLSNSDELEMEINHYEVIFNSSIEKLNNSNSGMKSIGGAAIGGVIGSMFGPIGTIIGSIAGSSLSGEASNDEVRYVGQQLCVEFGNIVETTNTYLESMARRMHESVEKYKQIYEGDSSYNKGCINN